MAKEKTAKERTAKEKMRKGKMQKGKMLRVRMPKGKAKGRNKKEKADVEAKENLDSVDLAKKEEEI